MKCRLRNRFLNFILTIGLYLNVEHAFAVWSTIYKDASLGDIAIETPQMLRNKMLELKVRLVPALNGRYNLVRFDAQMPEHRHGMIVKAEIIPNADKSRFEVRGVKFHMAGAWELQLDFEENGTGKKITVKIPLQVK